MKRIGKIEDDVCHNNLTVLIVEGNTSVRESLHNGLKRSNYDIISVRSAAEGNLNLEKQIIHVLITELILPQGNGFDLLRSVQQLRQDRKGFPYVIIVTAADTLENESYAEELGADEFIPKPVTVQEILQRLANFQRGLVFTNEGVQVLRV